jgi:hypothetical protein
VCHRALLKNLELEREAASVPRMLDVPFGLSAPLRTHVTPTPAKKML